MFGHAFDVSQGLRVIESLNFEGGVFLDKEFFVFSLLLDMLKTRGRENLVVVVLGLDGDSIVLVQSQLFRSQNHVLLQSDLPGGGVLLYEGFVFVLRQVIRHQVKCIAIVYQ